MDSNTVISGPAHKSSKAKAAKALAPDALATNGVNLDAAACAANSLDKVTPDISGAHKAKPVPAGKRGRLVPLKNADTSSAPTPDAAGYAATQPARTTRRDQIAALLKRKDGASLDELIAATGWLPHTTRAALSGLRKAGVTLERSSVDGASRYRIVV